MRSSFPACGLVGHGREPNLRRGVRRRLPPALQQRDFGFLWSAILSMRFAENMIAVAVGWQVYAIHKNPLDLGLVGLCEFLPLPLLALPAGQPRRPDAAPADRGDLADDHGRRRGRAARRHRRRCGRRLAVLPARRSDRRGERDRLAGEPGADPRGRTGRPRPERGRAAVGREHDRRDHRACGRRPALRLEARSGLRAGGVPLRGRRGVHDRAAGAAPRARRGRGGRPRRAGRGAALRLADEDAARRDHARSLRRALRRRDRAAADLRARHPPRRPGRARRPARRARRRRVRRGAPRRPSPARAARPGRR